MKIIGVSGVARSGKDTFSNGIVNYCESIGLKAIRVALADAVKEDLYDFLIEKFGISSFTSEDAEKNIIRPFLVAYGCAKRELTKGRYWTDLLHRKILAEKDFYDVFVISDIRFNEYEEDEASWVRNEMRGKLIHLTRMHSMGFVSAANETEAANDPKVKLAADKLVEWPTIPSPYGRQCFVDVVMEEYKSWLLQ